MHQRTDSGERESRRGLRVERRVAVRSSRLGVSGYADVVEVEQETGKVRPIEYKRGRPKRHRADEVQLCAQGICLEEMLGVDIPEGALFYGRTRRRTNVSFDTELRRLTQDVADATHDLVREAVTPTPTYESWKCDSCSLVDICRPRQLENPRPVAEWLADAVGS